MSISVNMQQIKVISGEFDKIGTTLLANEKKLCELMTELSTLWQGEAASGYLKAFEQNLPELQQMSKLMSTTGQTLNTISINYGKSEDKVSDIIKSSLAKG